MSIDSFYFYHNLDFIARIGSLSGDSGPILLADTKENIDPTNTNGSDLQAEEVAKDPPPQLSKNTLRLLANKKSLREKEVFELHSQLAECWEEIIKKGLDKEEKKSLLKKLPRKGNCSLFTPKLNEELIPLLSKSAKSRDKYLAINQDLCGLGLTALGTAIGLIFREEEEVIDKEELLEFLCNSSKYFCELMFQRSTTRKVYINSCVDEKWKPLLEKTETGEQLYDSLVKKVKAANAAKKLGLSLKSSAGKRTFFKPRAKLNWKGPPGRQTRGPQVGYRHYPSSQKYAQTPRSYAKSRQRPSQKRNTTQTPTSNTPQQK